MNVNIFIIPTWDEYEMISKGASFFWEHANPAYADRIEDVFVAALTAGASVQMLWSDFVDTHGVRRLDIFSNGWVKDGSSYITYPAVPRGIPRTQ